VSKIQTVCRDVQMHFGSSPPPRFTESSGQIFTIYVFKKEDVCCEVQTHFASFPLARLIKKLWARFHDLCVVQTNILDFNIL